MRSARTFLATLSTLITLACGGGGSDNSGNNNNPTAPNSPGATNGAFRAVLNGAQWGAIGQVSVTRGTNNFIGIAAAGTATGGATYAIVVGIGNATGPGTHTFNLAGFGDGSSLIVGGTTIGWGTAFTGGNGSVTITTLTANHIVGTFSGTAVPSTAGSGGNMVITNGTFDITF